MGELRSSLLAISGAPSELMFTPSFLDLRLVHVDYEERETWRRIDVLGRRPSAEVQLNSIPNFIAHSSSQADIWIRKVD